MEDLCPTAMTCRPLPVPAECDDLKLIVISDHEGSRVLMGRVVRGTWQLIDFCRVHLAYCTIDPDVVGDELPVNLIRQVKPSWATDHSIRRADSVQRRKHVLPLLCGYPINLSPVIKTGK
jgi:hypothetical protein